MEEVQTRNGLYGFDYRDTDLRRKPEGERKTYEIKALWQRNHEIVNLAARGFKQTDIAQILNIDPQTVSNTLGSQLGSLKLSEIRKGRDEEAKVVSEKIRVLTNRALEVYHEIFDNLDGAATVKDRKEVADTVLLELSGLRAPTKVQSQTIHTTLTPDELNEFKKRGVEAAKETGVIIDVEPEGDPGPNEVQATKPNNIDKPINGDEII